MAQVSAEKLQQNGSAEKERVAVVPQRKQLASTPEPPFPVIKRTESSRESDYEGGESQGGRVPLFGK